MSLYRWREFQDNQEPLLKELKIIDTPPGKKGYYGMVKGEMVRLTNEMKIDKKHFRPPPGIHGKKGVSGRKRNIDKLTDKMVKDKAISKSWELILRVMENPKYTDEEKIKIALEIGKRTIPQETQVNFEMPLVLPAESINKYKIKASNPSEIKGKVIDGEIVPE